MIVLVDGPEKAGKSTFVAELARVLNARIRHWGKVYPDDRVYTRELREDSASPSWIIWDRGWPSEHVYGKLLSRKDRRLANDPFLGEWLHGRAVQTVGLRCIMLPEDVSYLSQRRDSTDLLVDPKEEYAAFAWYGYAFGYTVLFNDYTRTGLHGNVATVASKVANIGVLRPPEYAGPQHASTVFVGEARNVNARIRIPGAWLPFSSRLTMELGRRLGHSAFNCGWTNIGDVPIEMLRNKRVVACGDKAAEWLSGTNTVRFVIPHPAWLYRYNTPQTRARRTTVDQLLKYLGEQQNV